MSEREKATYDIVAEKLNKSFNGRRVLADFDLEVRHGEAFAVIGGSGCGKTVLLKHLVGLLRPDSGRVLLFGQDINELGTEALDKLRRRVGIVFQGSALFESLTVAENVGLALEEEGVAREDVRRIVAEKLALVGMSGTEDLMPEHLSGGMKKRVGVARTLAREPEIILYDEPTTGLDPVMCDDVDELMLSMEEKVHVTSVVVTHDLITAFRVADRVGMMHEGRLIEVGSPREILNSNNEVVRTFVARHAVLASEGRRS